MIPNGEILTVCAPTKTGPHGAWACHLFQNKTRAEKWQVAEKNKLCYRCLGEDHAASKCTRTKKCGINGCLKTHHKLLHGHAESEHEQKKENTDNGTTKETDNSNEWFEKRRTGSKKSDAKKTVNENSAVEKPND